MTNPRAPEPFATAPTTAEPISAEPTTPDLVSSGQVSAGSISPAPAASTVAGDGVAWSPATRAVALGRPRGAGAPLNQPPVLASTFQEGGTDYARFGTDSTAAFEEVLGSLEGGAAVAFSTGMAAAASILETLPVGARVVTGSNIYHGVRSLLADMGEIGRLVDVPVDALDVGAVAQALDAALDSALAEGVGRAAGAGPASGGGPGAGAVRTEGAGPASGGAPSPVPATGAGTPVVLWLETPSNPLLQVLDVAALAAVAADRGVPVVVDSTFATPLRLRPLELGATYAVHSATKYIGGHSDLMMGAVVGRDEAAIEPIARRRSLHGAFPGALDTFLALRGLRTLAVRLDRAEANAAVLAERLAAHPAVVGVHYPGLPGDPGHEVAGRTMGGFGAMISFRMASEDAADRVLARTRLILMATSLGGVETTAERRNRWGEGTLTGLIRMSVGIEDAEDIWADLAQALDAEGVA